MKRFISLFLSLVMLMGMITIPTVSAAKETAITVTPALDGAAVYNGKGSGSQTKTMHSLDDASKTALAAASVGDSVVVSFDVTVKAGNSAFVQAKSGTTSGTNYVFTADKCIEARNGSKTSSSYYLKDESGGNTFPADTPVHMEITLPLAEGGIVTSDSTVSCVATYTDSDGNTVTLSKSGYSNYNAKGMALTGFEVWCRPESDSSSSSAESTATISNSSIKLVKAEKQVTLTNTFTDNMLIQRDKPIKITGTSIAVDGSSATVTLTNDNNEDTQTKNVSFSGTEWSVELDAVSNYTDTYTLTVDVADEAVEDITISNIIFGDLYLCGGQSNMWKEVTYYKNLDYYEADYKTDKNNIRILNLTSKTRSSSPLTELPEAPQWTTMNASLDYSEIPAVVYSIATKLQEETGVPVGVLATAYAGTYISQWLPTDIGLSNTKDNWFNTRIYPFKEMQLSGIFWYQGEQDRASAEGEEIVSYYTEKMELLIDEYRELFGNENLPFYYVEIPRVGNILDTEGDTQIAVTDNSSLAYVRQAQTDVYLKLKDSSVDFGIVPSLDIYGQKEYTSEQNGNKNARVNFHPGQKPVIAERLVNWALKDIYNRETKKDGSSIYTTGPVYKSSEAVGDKMIVTFECNGDLKVMDTQQYADDHSQEVWTANNIDTSKIQEFEIAGEDGVFYRAEAQIGEDKKSVVLTNDNVSAPRKVRYAFSGYGSDAYVECPNLTDDSNLPSLVFSKTAEKVTEPTAEPTVEPTIEPTTEPTNKPVITPTTAPDNYDNKAGYWKFDFGANTADGYIGVSHDKSFSDDLTYGFIGIKEDDYKLSSGEYMDSFRMVKGQQITLQNGNRAGDAPDNDFVAVTDERYPIRFTMSVENGGYYNVKVTLANASSTESANVSLFTERRHQLLTNVEIPAGQTLEYEFNVDVETYYWKALNGQYKDDTLSIEIVGKNAAISSMEVTKAQENGVTLWVQSDSTGCDQSSNFPYFNLGCYAGVGQALSKYLPEDIAVSNQGDGGLSTTDTNHYACAKAGFKAGDYFYIEYGHNESSAESYKSNLEKYYNDCHAAGVKMIVVGPIDRCQTKQFDAQTGTWSSTLSGYSNAGKEFVEEKIAAGAEDIAFVDLNAGWLDFLNETTSRVQQVRTQMAQEADPSATPCPYEVDSVYYYYKYKASGIDYTHINDAGADNAAYIFFNEAKKIVDSEVTSTFNVNVPENTKAVLYAASYADDGTLESVSMTEKNLVSGDNTIDVSDINADKFMIWDENMEPLAPVFEKQTLADVDKSREVQAAVLADLVNEMRDQTPYIVSEEIIRAGKVPNSYYPETIVEEYEGYEAEISKLSFDDNVLKNVVAKVEYYTGFETKGIPYGVVIAEMYDADNTLAGTYISTADTKYDTTNGNGTFTFNFNDNSAVLPEGGSYRVWIQGFTSDNEIMEGDEYRVSEYFTPDSKNEEYLIGDYDDIENPDSFSYYGVREGSDLNANNSWYLVGSAEKSATLKSETVDGQKIGYAELIKSSDSGSYVLYRAFENSVTNGKISLSTDLYYESGYARFTLSNKTSKPNSSLDQYVHCFLIDRDGYLCDGNGNQLMEFPKNQWTNITYEMDMDFGTQVLTVGNEEFSYNCEGLDGIISDKVNPSSIQQLNIMGSSSNTMSVKMSNVSVKYTAPSQLPEYTLTLTAPDSAMGTVAIADSEELTQTSQMNSLITISAMPADGYLFSGWYENGNLISATSISVIRLHRDVTLEARFEADNDPINYAYKQSVTALSTDNLAENGWVSKNAQSSLTVETDEEHGNYVYFNTGGNTRNVKVEFPEDSKLTEKYVFEMDLGISSGNSAMSEFTILSTDTTVPNNTSVTGGYIFKLTSTAKSASNSTSMVWAVNDNAEDTVTFTQSGTNPTWAHLKMIIDPATGDNEVVITENGAEIYSKTIKTNTTADNAVVGFNFKAGKSYGKGQFDNIKIYTASQIAQ